MVKCPKGTKEQIQANLTYLRHLKSCGSSEDESVCKFEDEYPPEVECPGEDLYLPNIELDEVRADKRNPPTTEDEITYLLVNHFLDILLKSWDGKPCLKPKLHEPIQSATDTSEEGEQLPGENDHGPEEPTSGFNVSTEYLNELYRSKTRIRPKGPQPERGTAEVRLSEVPRKPCESRRSLIEEEAQGEEDQSTDSAFSWKAVVPDEDVEMNFQNGAWYKGRVSRRLMDGDGIYFWEDGGSFQGEFIAGTATGFGRLEFPNLSVYEGTVYKGYRHGKGLHCMNDSPVMYTGEWWLGQKNGDGVIFYSDPVNSLNFYKGSWVNGKKEGFGYRQYPSGSKYVGYWKNGKRHGTGVMFWCNHDIYRGGWKDGLMEGFGEYIWNGFINKTFSYPRMNTYRGFWENGKRNGAGLLELTNGAIIETVWVNNEKNGPGAALSPNGTLILESKKLFSRDKPALLNEDEEDLTGLLFRTHGYQLNKKKNVKKEVTTVPDDGQLLAFMSSMEKAKAISIPIHTPVHSLDLACHVKRLHDQRSEFFIKRSEQISAFGLKNTPRIENINETKPCTAQDFNHQEEFYSIEEKLLRYSIMINLTKLKSCYEEWATIGCAEKPPFQCILLRLFFWELLTQAEVPRKNFSLADINEILGREDSFMIDSNHDPFERIQFWQFLHFLITISWYLYGRYIYADNICTCKNVKAFLEVFYNQNEKAALASAFNYFLQSHIFAVGDREPNRDLLKNKDVVPIQCMYMAYRSVGEPLSAKQFLCAVCLKPDETSGNAYYLEKIPDYKMSGKNAITFTSELSYIPSESPFNYPELFKMRKIPGEADSVCDLTCFAHLGAKKIVQCLVQVCPNMVEEDLIVDMEYQLTFLEFYKVVLACAEMSLQKTALKKIMSELISNYKLEMEEYERQMMEYERQKEAALAATKKPINMKKNKK